MEAFTTIAQFFQTGGGFMYPILVVLALGFSIALERFLYLQRTHRGTQRMWSQLVPMLKAQDFDRVVTATEESRSALAQVLNYGFARLGGTRKREDIESAMEEGLMEVLPKLEQRTHYLATFANIATLLGLLGTIIGLIHAFTAVANANPAEKADMLSASISDSFNHSVTLAR